MVKGYIILSNKRHARTGTVLFALLSFLVIAVAQIWHAHTGGEYHLGYLFIYAPSLLMLASVALRSYLFFLLATCYYCVHQLVNIVLLSMKEGAYSSLELFETFNEYALFFLGCALAWQAILFYMGHADNVALTHTSMLFVFAGLMLAFLPLYLQIFRAELAVTETVSVMCLGLSFVAFCTGIERIPEMQIEDGEK